MEEAGQAQKLKPLILVLDAEPILNAEGLWLLEHLRGHTFCTWFDRARVLIPAGLSVLERAVIEIGEAEPLDLTPRQQSIVDYLHTRRGPVRESALRETLGLSARDLDLELLLERGILKRSEQLRRRVQDDKVLMVRLTEDWSGPLTERQQDVFDFLAEAGDASLREIQYYTAATRGVVDGLVKKGAAELFEYIRPRDPYAGTAAPAAPPPALSAEQRAVADALVKSALGGRPKPALLYGVTGSGKTEVFSPSPPRS